MTFLQRLAISEMAAFIALLVLAVSLAVLAAISAALAETAVLGIGGSSAVVFGYTVVLGVVPALVLGAPGYAWLWHTGRASWLSAAALGLGLGAPLGFIALELGLWACAAGATVAVATHLACRAGANNSKPTSLRDAA